MARLRSPGSQKGKERRVLCFFGLKFCYKKMIEARTTDMGKGHGETTTAQWGQEPTSGLSADFSAMQPIR